MCVGVYVCVSVCVRVCVCVSVRACVCVLLSTRQVFWALGAVFEVLLAMVVMPTQGWRWLLALSAVPLAVFVALCYVRSAERLKPRPEPWGQHWGGQIQMFGGGHFDQI